METFTQLFWRSAGLRSTTASTALVILRLPSAGLSRPEAGGCTSSRNVVGVGGGGQRGLQPCARADYQGLGEGLRPQSSPADRMGAEKGVPRRKNHVLHLAGAAWFRTTPTACTFIFKSMEAGAEPFRVSAPKYAHQGSKLTGFPRPANAARFTHYYLLLCATNLGPDG